MVMYHVRFSYRFLIESIADQQASYSRAARGSENSNSRAALKIILVLSGITFVGVLLVLTELARK
jgi:hypothetical protein